MSRPLFLMFVHVRLICALIKITYLLTYLLTLWSDNVARQNRAIELQV